MILNRAFDEYPFFGTFYSREIDETLPLDQQTEGEVEVLSTICDIQESSKGDSYGVNVATFNIYFPFNKDNGINLKRGMIFRGSKYGLEVDGIIIGVDATMLGGCVCHIKDLDS